MANARAVEEVAISGKTRKKTSVFWSTVPENEQFRNVQIPGVALNAFKDTKKSSQAQKYVQVVQKSKSDSAILNARTDSLTAKKQAKVGHIKLTVKQNDLLGEKKDVSIKGAASSDQLADMSSLSESSAARRASLKNLNVEDKKRVANLIKELAKTGEERELALERLQEERVSFEERLSAVQDEQTLLRQERESLKQRLEKSEKLMKQYENELKDVKTEKEQDKLSRKRFQAQPQSTQTSPLIQTTDEKTSSRRFKSVRDIEPGEIKKSLGNESNDTATRDGQIGSSTPSVPVYSNSLFDVKVSNAENSESRSVSEEYQRSGVTESSGLHELYLREYSLQLRLQEQQIEIQRQQVQLQQQLQLLQQQQQQQDLGQVRPKHNQQQQQEQHHQQQQQDQQELSKEGHKQRHQKLPQHQRHEHNEENNFHQQQQRQEEPHLRHQHKQDQQERSNNGHKEQTQEWPKQHNQQAQHSQNVDEEHRLLQEQPLNQKPYSQPQNWHHHQEEPQYLRRKNNETILEQRSPTQQTNLLQKRTPERRGRRTEPKHRPDNAPHEHPDPLAQQRYKHDYHTHVVKTSRQENEAVRYGQPQNRGRSYPPQEGVESLHSPYHHVEHGDEKPRYVGEYHTNRNTGVHGTESTHYYSEQHYDMTQKKSPRKHHQPKDTKIDFNNNEYFQPRHYSLRHQQNNYRDSVQDRYPPEYLSDPNEPFSENDCRTDEEHYCSSERRCHCGYYHNHTRQQHLTSEDHVHPISKHGHFKGIPQHTSPDPNQKSPQSITENPHLTAEAYPAQIYQPNGYQHLDLTHRSNSHHQKLLYDPDQSQLPENVPSLGYHHQTEYHHHPHTREEHSPQDNDHYQYVQPDVIYQSWQETNRKHPPTERRVYERHQSGFPAHSAMSLSRHAGKTEHAYPVSEELQRSQEQDHESHKTKALLDDYIYNHQTENKGDKQPTKRVIWRKVHDEKPRKVDTIQRNEHSHLAIPYITNSQCHDEDVNLNPGYSLYKPNMPQTPERTEQHPPTKRYPRSTSKSYPNSLVEIVESLEINAQRYEESYSEETEHSAEEPAYDSEEEESTVLDNIFFLKR